MHGTKKIDKAGSPKADAHHAVTYFVEQITALWNK